MIYIVPIWVFYFPLQLFVVYHLELFLFNQFVILYAADCMIILSCDTELKALWRSITTYRVFPLSNYLVQSSIKHSNYCMLDLCERKQCCWLFKRFNSARKYIVCDYKRFQDKCLIPKWYLATKLISNLALLTDI